MAKFSKSSNNTISLISNGSIKDGHKIAEWARKLATTCDAKVINKEQAFILSASHRDDYSPRLIELSFIDYYFSDINTWLKICKK